MNRVYCIIPARLHSTRMPRKLLRNETDFELICETIGAASVAYNFCEVIVATDSEEIAEAARNDKIAAVVKTGECASGTDRIWEAIESINREAREQGWEPLNGEDLIVNIQADEPEIKPEHIKALIDAATSMPSCDITTLAAPLCFEDRHKSNVVKVSRGIGGYATGFSRSYARNAHHHLGVYAYTPRFLKWFTSLPQSANEQRERLEQLRALDNGARIRVALVDEAWPGIDTEEEYQAFVKRWKERQCPTTQSASA